MARLSFNAHEVEDNGDGGGGGGGFQALSTGEYTCVVHDTDIRPTKRGDGEYLLIVWEVVEGLFKGQRVWDRFNVRNPNPQAVEIANKQLRECALALGVPNFEDTMELHGKRACLKVVKTVDDKYGEGNDVKFYKSVHAAAAPVPPPTEKPYGDDDIPF
jgi:hypothetical protein